MSTNAFYIERSTGLVTCSQAPLVRFNDVLPFTVALTDSAVANTTALGNGALGAVLRITGAAGAVLAQCTAFSIVAGVATGKFVLSDEAENLIFTAPDGAVYVEFSLSEKTGPRLSYSLTATVSTSGSGSGDVSTSAPVFLGAIVTTESTVADSVVDTAKSDNVLTITGATTLTVSATPAVNRTRGVISLFNNSATESVLTLPTSPAWFSEALQAEITTITPPAGWRGEFSWCWDGTRFLVKGEPVALRSALNTIGKVPLRSFSSATDVALTDVGCALLHPSTDTTARTVTIPANASVPIPVESAVTFINQASAGVVTIAITSDTMRLAGAGNTGSRTLAANGIATAVKLTATEWLISGTGLT